MTSAGKPSHAIQLKRHFVVRHGHQISKLRIAYSAEDLLRELAVSINGEIGLRGNGE